ncbi:MAG: hemerythrin domain-containing protein, partial [Pseudomonadota bacterium]
MNAATEKLPLPQDAPAFAGPDELIDHLLSRYHEVHRQQLPELIRLARKVESVHQGDPAVPVGLADLLEVQQQELLSHMQKEEQILFPMLRAGGNPFISQPIAMMRHEHVEHGLQLEKLVSLTNG